MAAIIQINGGTAGVSDDNVTLGSTVTLYSVDAATTYQWAIVSQPAGLPDALVTPTQRGASFVASKEGSYLLLLTVDDGLPTESTQQLIAAVRELETGDRIPAIGETVENSANDGWANPVDAILERVTRFTDAGVLPGVAGASGLAVGSIVYPSGVYELASGLPGARVVASWEQALANDAATVQGVYGVIVSSVLGGTIAANDVISVQVTGLYQGIPGSPAVGDPVFISDLGDFSLTAGTLTRQIGTVCAVGGGTYDVMVGPAPAEIDAPAGGDLSGAFPDPTVVGLQGNPISATAPTSGQVLKWSGAAWAPAADSTTPSGAAGGVLGYTGSTYPNPSGLAPVTGSTIPVKGTVAAVTIFEADSANSVSQAPGIALYAGQNAGAGPGGDALLVGGTVSTGVGGDARVTGGDGGTTGGTAQLRAGASSDALGAYIVAEGGYTTTGGALTQRGGNGNTGGALDFVAGQGFAGDGGAASLTAGAGTAAGGNATVSAGNGVVGGATLIASGNGSGGAAGALDVFAGVGTGGVGGDVSVRAGSSSTHGGGSATLRGGAASALGTTSGGATVDAGAASGSATEGTVSVGTANASSTSIGRSGKDVKTFGRNVGVPTTYAPTAATTIPVNGPTVFLNPASNVDMTASPTLQTSGVTAGTIVTLVNEDSTYYVDFTQDNAGTSYLKLATGNIFLFKYDTVTFIFDGTYWVEVGRNIQPGKSYTPVAGTTIPFYCPTVLLANTGAVNLGTANATIQTVGVNAGSRITFVQKAAGSTTFARGGSSGLKLSNPTHVLSQYATLELVFDGTFWCQLSQSNNA